jgi:hypothetical protein
VSNNFDDPPDRITLIIFIIVLLLGIGMTWGILRYSRGKPQMNYPLPERNESVVYAMSSHHLINDQTLGAIAGSYYIKGIEVSRELYYISKCESNFRPDVCNQKFGCSSGMGILQIVSSTLRECERELGKSLDPFDVRDSIDCGEYLLTTPQGVNHWGYPPDDPRGYVNGFYWGSWECWSKYLVKNN